MKKSLSKWNKFFSSLFYAVLLALPMLSVLARVVYVQTNNNANVSYSEYNIERTINLTNSNSGLLSTGNNYYFKGVKNPIGVSTGNHITFYFTFTQSSINLQSYFNTSYEIDGLGVSTDGNFATYFRLFARDKIVGDFKPLNSGNIIRYDSDFYLLKLQDFTFSFTLDTFNSSIINAYNLSFLYISFGTLDNAFEYSISKVIDTYGTGNINFVNWFGDMFFDNPQNLLYLNFVNMYLNYSLLVSVAYLMYLFLSFFIQIIRELIFSFIDKTNKVGD